MLQCSYLMNRLLGKGDGMSQWVYFSPVSKGWLSQAQGAIFPWMELCCEFTGAHWDSVSFGSSLENEQHIGMNHLLRLYPYRPLKWIFWSTEVLILFFCKFLYNHPRTFHRHFALNSSSHYHILISFSKWIHWTPSGVFDTGLGASGTSKSWWCGGDTGHRKGWDRSSV